MKPLKLIAANDTFGALVALGQVVDNKLAIFITAPEVNGKMPETFGLPETVADDVALIVETSGSTGEPKRIEISRDALLASANASQVRLGGPGQWLLALPINYIAGSNVLIRALVADTQPILMNTSVPFTAEAFGRAASLMSGTRRYTSLVPTQLYRLLEAIATVDEFLLATMRKFDAILVGGQAPTAESLAQAAGLGLKIVVTYGMTETCGGCIYDGEPLDGVDVEIHRGVIRIAGATLANVETEDGWFSTNDLGDLTDDGKWVVIGRADRVIKSGGIKISLDRVEQIARLVPGVNELAAAPINDASWGQRVGIAYTGSPEVADDIAMALANDLGPAGKPVRILRTDKLPKLANAKIDLPAVQQLF